MRCEVIRKLKTFNCPHDYQLEIKCAGGGSRCQMGKCWDKTLKKYELLVSEEPIYKNSFRGYTFAFKKKEEKSAYNINEIFKFREGTSFEDENGVEYKVIDGKLKLKMPILTRKWIEVYLSKENLEKEFTLLKKY